MKILIVSDTHGKNDNLKAVIKRVSPIDLLIHLGDSEGSQDIISDMVDCPVMIVAGNNDFFSPLDKEIYTNIGKYKVLITHGHRYNVYDGPEDIISNWKDADVIMYGHTHRPSISVKKGRAVLNPGSISYPRQEDRIPTFIVMDIDESGDAHYTLNYLKK